MSKAAQDNPILVELTRGALVESSHRGAIAVADAEGRLALALGAIERPVYPRSAVKALQAIPLIESGAAEAFGLGESELAIACASHSAEALHLAAVRTLLTKAGLDERQLACGAHWPISERAMRELMRAGQRPEAIHNNCSGKHTGMLATALHRGVDPRGYEQPDHPVQEDIRRVISEVCGVELERGAMGIDGCSVPTFALPLHPLATGFARLASGKGLSQTRAAAVQRLMGACFAAPVLVAGEERFDTIVMRGLGPAAFVKGGAEGVHCAALPELGIGIALKIDDGAKRAAETALAFLLARLIAGAEQVLSDQLEGDIRNWRGLKVGWLRASAELMAALEGLPRPTRGAAAAAPR
ncbi:MAG: asparaginase [Methyloceanibacter sp.]|jgi:L-asparaginase II